jgi:RNA polymerase sigma-B factor
VAPSPSFEKDEIVVPKTADPSHHSHAKSHDVDDEIEVLAGELSTTTDPGRRAELVEGICLLALPLADLIALRFRGRGIESDDLQQVARTALVKAVNRYRPGAGCGFAAYASPTISGEVKRWFRDHGWSVRPPRRLQELRAVMTAQEETLRHHLGRDPSIAELAAQLEVSATDVAEAKVCSAGYHAASLDVPTSAGTAVGEHLLVTAGPFELIDSRAAMRQAVDQLTDRQRRVLHLRYVEDLTQSQIGEHIGVSQMQVSRILRSTLALLRCELGNQLGEVAEPAA